MLLLAIYKRLEVTIMVEKRFQLQRVPEDWPTSVRVLVNPPLAAEDNGRLIQRVRDALGESVKPDDHTEAGGRLDGPLFQLPDFYLTDQGYAAFVARLTEILGEFGYQPL